MTKNQKIQHYAVYMKMYATMMIDLAEDEDYVARLIESDRLSAFEQALRLRIEKSPRC